jgi:hypothetical protein
MLDRQHTDGRTLPYRFIRVSPLLAAAVLFPLALLLAALPFLAWSVGGIGAGCLAVALEEAVRGKQT